MITKENIMKNNKISNPERAQAIADHINSCVEEGLSWTVDWDAEREAERDSEFGPEKALVLERISQLNKLANYKPEQQ